jgi:hypothetical protein
MAIRHKEVIHVHGMHRRITTQCARVLTLRRIISQVILPAWRILKGIKRISSSMASSI